MSTAHSQQVPVEIDEVEVLISPQLALPSLDLLSNETRDTYLKQGVPLYHAALKGDWETVQGIVEAFPDLTRARISKGRETALHIAAAARRTRLVKELVNLMTEEDLALQNNIGNTALCFAASSGAVESAKVMVEKNQALPMIRGSRGMTPLYMAALLGHRDMVCYLYSVTGDNDLTPGDRIGLLATLINTDLYDVALDMVKRHPELAIARDGNEETALHVLARKPQMPHGYRLGVWRKCVNLFAGNNYMDHNKNSMPPQALQLVECVWQQVVQLSDSEISELIGTPWRLLFIAAELGNVEFITTLIRYYPDLIWKVEENRRSIFHVAIMHRHEKIFNLIYELGAIKDLIATYKDDDQNNMLHLAGMLAPPSRLNSVSGAALQMQRELLWFKEVEKIVQPLYAKAKNIEGKTPQALFTENHNALMIRGEKWMKNTATSCMLVATLIATVVFATAFQVPGGNNDNGSPNLLKKESFMVFAISDAISLFSSVSSILMFLSILTSRYAEDDFLHSLPLKLMMGLTSLFVSIATMMVAFSATFFIVFDDGLARVAIPIALIACVPVTLFAFQQYPLLADIIHSTYGSNFLFHPSKHVLY